MSVFVPNSSEAAASKAAEKEAELKAVKEAEAKAEGMTFFFVFK